MKRYLLAFSIVLIFTCYASDPLPSWNEGKAKQAILDFVKKTTDKASSTYVPVDERIATFDQDGTLWVEQPIYTQIQYCFARLPIVLTKKPQLQRVEPFKSLLKGNCDGLSKMTVRDLEKIMMATLTGMTTEQFFSEVKQWITTAKDTRWKRPYTELVYKPMLEMLKYLRANGYKTYIVTGGGQDFVRTYSEQIYGIPVEQVIGTAVKVKYGYDESGRPNLSKEPEILLNDNFGGKPEGIHLFIGRRPVLAVGNSTGDQQMLEYTSAGDGLRLSMLILHDDPVNEYAYGPALGLPQTKVGEFTQQLYDLAKQKDWIIVSMKTDWKRVFSFTPD